MYEFLNLFNDFYYMEGKSRALSYRVFRETDRLGRLADGLQLASQKKGTDPNFTECIKHLGTMTRLAEARMFHARPEAGCQSKMYVLRL
jgi:hypothetical protein